MPGGADRSRLVPGGCALCRGTAAHQRGTAAIEPNWEAALKWNPQTAAEAFGALCYLG